jgi:cation diffusion facilitator CzcD-associated flavoprotein CzcO
MNRISDVAIIGAGPYGLSLAAHLRGRGLSVRIFGKALDTWKQHMPKGMHLKSEGFASSLSAPDAGATLKDWCAQHAIAYADQHQPVALETFNAYAAWFCNRFVPDLEQASVTSLSRTDNGFSIRLESGEHLEARHVVLAVGITSFANRPTYLDGLPPLLASHSYDHRELEGFRGRNVTVIGAGASAIDIAALLADNGASVRIVARTPKIAFHSPPDPTRSFFQRLLRPASDIGPGWRSWLCANAPLIFHRLPESLRLRATKRHLGPSAGWFMRQRIEGRVRVLTDRRVLGARMRGERALLDVIDDMGRKKTIESDHIIAATGYRPDLRRLSFLSPILRANILQVENTPVLSSDFETSVRGLYFVGPAAANAFGPLMRFMAGATFVAPRLASHLARRSRRFTRPNRSGDLSGGERLLDRPPHRLAPQLGIEWQHSRSAAE